MTQPIGYARACQELAASRALIQQGMAQVRGPAAVPPMDPRVPKLVAAREFVRQIRELSKAPEGPEAVRNV